MEARTGKQYLADLRGSREVWLGAQRVDVATHPAFAGSRADIAGYFDWQHEHARECLFEDPQTGHMAAAFDVPQLAPKLERYLPGARGVSAQERAKLFRTAWDFVGSALGSRTELYERFYLASSARTLGIHHMLAQRERPWTAVPEFLARSGS